MRSTTCLCNKKEAGKKNIIFYQADKRFIFNSTPINCGWHTALRPASKYAFWNHVRKNYPFSNVDKFWLAL
jgi:hypothetical protein